MLADGASHFEIARDLQIALTSVEWIESGRHPRLREEQRQERLQPRPIRPHKAAKRKRRRQPYRPSPETIAAECERLRSLRVV